MLEMDVVAAKNDQKGLPYGGLVVQFEPLNIVTMRKEDNCGRIKQGFR